MQRAIVIFLSIFIFFLQIVACVCNFREVFFLKFGGDILDIFLSDFYVMSYPLTLTSVYFYDHCAYSIGFCFIFLLINIFYAVKTIKPNAITFLWVNILFCFFTFFLAIGEFVVTFSPYLLPGSAGFILLEITILTLPLLLYADLLLHWRKALLARFSPSAKRRDS